MKTEHSGTNLTKVNQHEIKALLEERILNPKKYTDRPLLIWRGYFEDGIQDKVFFNIDPQIRERMHKQFRERKEPYKQPPREEDVALTRKVFIELDNLNENRFFFPDKELNLKRFFCFILEFPDKNHINDLHYEQYSGLINTDWLMKELEWLNAPIVVYLPFIEQPEAFKGFDQYVFNPDYDEWKEENLKYEEPLIKHLIGFLENSGGEEERNYRWYWYFQRQKNGENSSELKSHFEGNGCPFPSCWMDGIWNLRGHFNIPMAQIPKNYIPPKPVKISEIPVDEFKAFFNVGISEDVVDDFRKYLIEYNVEVQGNIKNPYI